jgi:hypothetical protein
MKQFLFRSGMLLLVCSHSLLSCKKTRLEESANKSLSNQSNVLQQLPDYSKLADVLEKKILDSNPTGYSFVIHYKGLKVASRAGGFARRAQDVPSMAMSIHKNYSIASVSKTISAAALICALKTAPNTYNMIDQPMYTYLPSHWNIPANIKKITFRQLLNHTSGIRMGGSSVYMTLKQMVENDVQPGNMGIYSYNNHNFGLLRLLIPKLAGYDIPKLWNGIGVIDGAVNEDALGNIYDNYYKHYCRIVIFKKVTSTADQVIDCDNTDTWPALYYRRPAGGTNGIFIDDITHQAGGEGWVLTTDQMGDFFRTLHYTEKILPKNLTDAMRTELLGYDVIATTNDGVGFYWKNGIYGIAPTIAPAYRSLIIGFGDDLQFSIMTNSGMVLQNVAIAAHEEWYGSRIGK